MKRLGKYTVCSAKTVTRSMSSSRTIGTITLEGNSTHANIGTQKFLNSMMPASTSTPTNTLLQENPFLKWTCNSCKEI